VADFLEIDDEFIRSNQELEHSESEVTSPSHGQHADMDQFLLNLSGSQDSADEKSDPDISNAPSMDFEMVEVEKEEEELLLSAIEPTQHPGFNRGFEQAIDIDNFLLFEVFNPQVHVEAAQVKGTVMLYIATLSFESRLICLVENGGYIPITIDSGTFLNNLRIFVTPMDIDMSNAIPWIAVENDTGILKPIMAPMSVSGTIGLRLSSRTFTNIVSHHGIVVSVPLIYFQIESSQLFLLIGVIESVFVAPFPFEESVDEEIQTFLFSSRLEVSPEKYALDLIKRRNHAKWQYNHLTWLIDGFGENGPENEPEIVVLNDLLRHVEESMISAESELRGMIAVCKIRAANRSPIRDVTDVLFDALDFRFSLNEFSVDLIQVQLPQPLLHANFRGLSVFLKLDEFMKTGRLYEPQHIIVSGEIATFVIRCHTGDPDWRRIVGAFDASTEFDERRVMLGVKFVRHNVNGVMVVPHLEFNLAHLEVKITYDLIMKLVDFFTKPIAKARGGLVPQGLGVLGVSDVVQEEPSEGEAKTRTLRSRNSSSARLLSSSKDTEKDIAVKQMQYRAKKFITFTHIRLGTVRLTISYKGSNQANLEDVEGLKICLKAHSYRNKSWTLGKLAKRLRRDYINSILSQVTEALKSFLVFKLGLAGKEQRVDMVSIDEQMLRHSNIMVDDSKKSWVDKWKFKGKPPKMRTPEEEKRRQFMGI